MKTHLADFLNYRRGNVRKTCEQAVFPNVKQRLGVELIGCKCFDKSRVIAKPVHHIDADLSEFFKASSAAGLYEELRQLFAIVENPVLEHLVEQVDLALFEENVGEQQADLFLGFYIEL